MTTPNPASSSSFGSGSASGAPCAYCVPCPHCLAPTTVGVSHLTSAQDIGCMCAICPAVWMVRAIPASAQTIAEMVYVSAMCDRCGGADAMRMAPASRQMLPSGLPSGLLLRWECGVCGHIGAQVQHITALPSQPGAAKQQQSSLGYGQLQGYSWGQSAGAQQPATSQSALASQTTSGQQPGQPQQPQTADELRDQARELAFNLASGIADALREVRADAYPPGDASGLVVGWEDLQRALDTLYVSLGGRRNIGDYAPDPFNTRRDVTQAAMRLILLLRVVEQMAW